MAALIARNKRTINKKKTKQKAKSMRETKRFVSLDVLRGLTVVGMIMVNTQGEGERFDFLNHCAWDGCRVADLVYPFFLFIVGAAIYFVFRKTNYELNGQVVKKVLKRGALIFLIGFLLNIFPFTGDPATWRILGVMQRIAIVYVAASFLTLWLRSLKRIALLTAVILVGYWALLAIPGYTLEDNLVLTVDRLLFGEQHLFTGYGIYFDPEGLLSSIPAVANALLGFMTSALLLADHRKNGLPWRTAAVGAGLIALGLLWNVVFPFNKPLWTSSFVVYTCGWAIVLWVAAFVMIDLKGWTGWTGFFRVFGTNALFTYILSELLVILNWMFPFSIGGEPYVVSTWLDKYLFSAMTTTPLRAALWGVLMVAVCWLATYPLYRRKIFIKL